jgi:DNA-directed RNA polymerase specialized sigma24 family protein
MALVAQARRELLLRAHRHRLSKEDLEDCYSQATLELLAQARGGGVAVVFSTRAHIANVLEQRFVSRIQDRRRALRGRSPAQAALNNALPLGDGRDGIEVADVRAEIERLVMLRMDLRSLGKVIHDLTPDQRLVLISGADSGMECTEFCRRFGWSKEKYRKVVQRARARLRELLAREQGLAGEEDFCMGGVPSGADGRRRG